MTVLDLTESIAPKSDQLNADDLITGPRTFTISEVRKGTAEQPFDFHLVENPGHPYRPSKSMRRVMVEAWKERDASKFVGRRITLFRNPDIKFGGQTVGGIQISHMSHLDKPFRTALTETRGKRATFTVQPLKDEPTGPTPADVQEYIRQAEAADDLDEWRKVWKRAHDAGHLTDALKAKLTPLGEALKKPEPGPSPRSEAEDRTGGERSSAGVPDTLPARTDESATDWPAVAPIPGTES